MSEIEVCNKTEMDAMLNQIKETQDDSTTIEVIGLREPKESREILTSIASGNMLRLLTGHLA